MRVCPHQAPLFFPPCPRLFNLLPSIALDWSWSVSPLFSPCVHLPPILSSRVAQVLRFATGAQNTCLEDKGRYHHASLFIVHADFLNKRGHCKYPYYISSITYASEVLLHPFRFSDLAPCCGNLFICVLRALKSGHCTILVYTFAQGSLYLQSIIINSEAPHSRVRFDACQMFA